MYVYLKSKGDELWTVGFYDPSGAWHPESDHGTPEEAAQRVNWLNGGEARDAAAKWRREEERHHAARAP